MIYLKVVLGYGKARIVNNCYHAVFYCVSAYPDNVVRAFCHRAVQEGMDIFRLVSNVCWSIIYVDWVIG